MTETMIRAGLDGVVAAQTRLSGVDGQAGELIIAGFPVEELAANATFEETIYLLWRDALPAPTPLQALRWSLAERRALPALTQTVLQAAARQRTPIMDALRMAVGTFSLAVPAAEAPEGFPADTSAANVSVSDATTPASTDTTRQPEPWEDFPEDALMLTARMPTAVAAYWRLLQSEAPVAPRSDLGHAANYLYMLTGEVPGEERVRALETYLNTVVDHGLNASTFAARVILSTQSDLVSAVVGAIGALKGPLHGGAPGPALDMVFEIGSADRIEPYLRAKLERGERLMGFGHRIYKVRDPRADVLCVAAERLYRADGDRELYRLARQVEAAAIDLLEEYKPGRNLQTNVEFYTALLLHGLGLPTALFTPTFAIGRVVGWIAHGFEQQDANRIIRPQSVYIGPRDRKWVPLEQRS